MSDKDDEVINGRVEWQTVLPPQKLSADAEHEFAKEIAGTSTFSHVRLNIFPDGGVSRLRVFGKKRTSL